MRRRYRARAPQKPAVTRHPALTGRNTDTDISVELNPSYEMEFTIRVGAGTMARLVQILNSAPVDGNPLNAIVNLWGDTTVSECEREDILYFLSENGYDATLENIAAGYLYAAENDEPLEIDVVTTERKEYVVARVLSKGNKGDIKGRDGRDLASYISLRLPKKEVLITSSEVDTDHINFEGMHIGKYRIMHKLEPGGKAPLGGFILENTK